MTHTSQVRAGSVKGTCLSVSISSCVGYSLPSSSSIPSNSCEDVPKLGKGFSSLVRTPPPTSFSFAWSNSACILDIHIRQPTPSTMTATEYSSAGRLALGRNTHTARPIVVLRHLCLIDLLVQDGGAVSEDLAPTSPEEGCGRTAAFYHAGALRLTFPIESAEC